MKNKVVKIFLIVILIISCSLGISYVRADSGWDYDYDSGSSWDSGSDWDSDWDNDYSSSRDNDYSSSGNRGGSMPNQMIIFISICTVFGFISILLFVYITLSKAFSKTHKNAYTKNINSNKSHIYSEKSNEEIEFKLGMNKNEFNELAFNIYKNIQNAWSEFDYETLKKYTTNELYNTYSMQLETLKLKNQKNIMTDIVCNEVKIIQIKEKYSVMIVTVYMNISMYDYVVDKNGKVTRGTNKKKANIEYEITFVSNIGEELNCCPNCGAEIKDIVNGKCTYCRSEIVKKSKEFVMSKKTCINQRME